MKIIIMFILMIFLCSCNLEGVERKVAKEVTIIPIKTLTGMANSIAVVKIRNHEYIINFGGGVLHLFDCKYCRKGR